MMRNRIVLIAIVVATLALIVGCQAGHLFGAMAQSHEYQKLIDTPPMYSGLENRTVAVLVEADLSTLYEHPTLIPKITDGISRRIQRDVPGAKVAAPQAIINWQYRTPQWNALPYGEMAQQLNVDRIVHIDILEYRLNPPGNRWIWDGVCSGHIGIVERDAIDPDIFMQTFEKTVKFPGITGVGRESATADRIETGLLAEFVKQTAWLFHQHLEPKYPDKYRPELDAKK